MMSRGEAIVALCELAYQFHNEMVRRGIKELAADEWLVEFRAWMPTGTTFAQKNRPR